MVTEVVAIPEVEAGATEMYPVVLKLDGRHCLVVGGGPIALRKTGELLRCGAFVHAVAADWPADFTQLVGNERLRRSSRPFDRSDLEGVFLVVAATDDRATQEAVARGAEEWGILCNVVDVPELCNFIVPAILRRGSLMVAVSTEGKSPLLAVAVRDRLATLVGPHLGAALERLAEGRAIVRALHPDDPERRRRALFRLLSPEAARDLLEGRLDSFERHWSRWKSSLSE
ncbi:MAG TPA: bifunctional precorrin-2 dehydrogenase/sirohydrochlorin ferrochelatase [Candidatus Polarisedimenticolia bacterium]|nr:bifunctional precorrin-2 dehydrogenase/sirohydrochlorin ferrochelatase [Candidatus Polarisedimenticolia bacterium]